MNTSRLLLVLTGDPVVCSLSSVDIIKKKNDGRTI